MLIVKYETTYGLQWFETALKGCFRSEHRKVICQ